MNKNTYTAIKIVQKPDSPPMYVISSSAGRLLQWCDVPRSKAEYMAGYQRTLGKRHEKITAYYLESPHNITPGAVIVAVDEDYVTATENGPLVQLEVKGDDRTFEQKLMEVFGVLTTRLSDDELLTADIVELDRDDGEDGLEDGDDEHAPPASYLATLAGELKQAVEDFDSLGEDRQFAIRDYIEGTSKPGLIIDGQHRVFGAKGVNAYDIELPVVILPGLQHAEQVFHFYVLNSKAVPLRKSELRRIISTSLTDAEIETLYERFSQAGVEAEEARWTYQMHTRSDSPFNGLVDFGFGNTGEIIPENVADQLVKRFTKQHRKTYGTLISPVKEKWEDGDFRLECFFALWRAVQSSESYARTWDEARESAQSGKQSQLFRKVGLIVLQKFLLDKLTEILLYQEDANPYGDWDDMDELVGKIVANIPGEFFEREWKLAQMDTSEGHEDLYKEMETVYKKRGKVDGRTRLFKGA